MAACACGLLLTMSTMRCPTSKLLPPLALPGGPPPPAPLPISLPLPAFPIGTGSKSVRFSLFNPALLEMVRFVTVTPPNTKGTELRNSLINFLYIC